MSDERIGKLAEDALATLRGLPDARQLPRELGWGDVMTVEGWSVRRARQAQRALGLRLVERGGSVADVRPTPSYMQCAPRRLCRGALSTASFRWTRDRRVRSVYRPMAMAGNLP